MSSNLNYAYDGNELDLFAHAQCWKHYFTAIISPFIRGDVVEVGAGIGSNTNLLISNSQPRSWLAIEPDQNQAKVLANTIAVPSRCGTVFDLPLHEYDTVLYIDVLEHIKNDREELIRAAERLRPGGHIVVLAPAHMYLYSQFDRSIGHFRRYQRADLEQLTPPACEIEMSIYLDSVGWLASLGNRAFLRQSLPTLRQILLWDRVLVRLSRFVDRLCFYRAGKTVVVVWQKR